MAQRDVGTAAGATLISAERVFLVLTTAAAGLRLWEWVLFCGGADR